MNRFVEKVGVAIASRIGIAAAIVLIAAGIGGVFYWRLTSDGPRSTIKVGNGVKVDVEELSFYDGSDKITGTVYRPSDSLDETMTAVIYCQDTGYGESWCSSLAGTGAVCYCFNFNGDGEKARVRELEAVIDGIRDLRYADKDRVFLLGEGNGCLTASTATFDKPKLVKGLILVSPGFNPLEISRKAKRYNGTILVVDDSEGRQANIEEIKDFIY